MTREEAKRLLPIIQAYAEGKDIEYRSRSGDWMPNRDTGFSTVWEYRISQTPKELWLVKTGVKCECGEDQLQGYHVYTHEVRPDFNEFPVYHVKVIE